MQPEDKGKLPRMKLHELPRCVQEEFETTFHLHIACHEAAITIENNQQDLWLERKKERKRKKEHYMFYKWCIGGSRNNTIAPYAIFCPFASQIFCKLIDCSWKQNWTVNNQFPWSTQNILLQASWTSMAYMITLTFTCCIDWSSA